MTIKEKLKKLIEQQKKESFTDPNQIKDSEALGIMISQFFEWDGQKIFNSAYYAFEDSNFHTFNEKFDIDNESEYPYIEILGQINRNNIPTLTEYLQQENI